MSYRNPQQFIDKQSGQAYVDLIKTSIGVGDAMAKRAREKAKANEKENLRLIKEREQGVLNLRTEFNKRSGDNFNADDWEPMVQRYDIIQQKIDKGTATAQEKQEQAKILAAPYTAKSLGENLLSDAEEMISSIGNVGKMGGFDAKGSSPEGLKNAQTFLGQLSGANNLTFVDREAAFDINGKVYTESSVREFLNRDLGANVLGRIIPDEGPNFKNAHEFSLMPDPGGSTDPNKRVMNPAYLTGIQKREENNGDITYYRTPNFDLLRQPGNPVGAELRADAQSLLDMPGNSAVSLWNNTLQVDKTKEVIWDYDEILTDKQKEDFVEAYVDYGLGANYFTQEIIERTEKAPRPKELTVTERKAAKTAKEIAEAAPRVYTDIFKNPESYFKNKKIGGKDVLKVNVSPGSVPADGGEVYPIIELGYKSGTSTADGEQTVFTNDMIFDLSDPARVRALIDMLPEGADMKKELRKLVGDDPIESVSIETFEQTPPIYKGISL